MQKCAAQKVQGYSHQKKDNAPCQDAYLIHRFDGGIIAAVADGHGSSIHRYSADGSRIAVETAVDLIKEIAEGGNLAGKLAEANLPLAIETEWKRRVKKFHYELVEEGRRDIVLDLKSKKPTMNNYYSLNILYGSTLLAAVLTEEFLFALQIGDGDITVLTRDGTTAHVIESEEQVGSATNSLCMVDCAQYFRIKLLDFSERYQPELLFLSTDGYANSYANNADFLKLLPVYRDALSGHSEQETEEAMQVWLADTSKRGSGDDITAVAVYRYENSSSGMQPDEHAEEKDEIVLG